MIEIAKALNLGERDTNHLLMSAGFRASPRPADFHGDELKWLRKAMILSLRAADPYPATLTDGSSNILMVNKGWVNFYRQFVGFETLNKVHNHLEFVFDRAGAGKLVSGWEDTLSVILMGLQQRALFTNDPHDQALHERLAQHPAVPADWQQRGAQIEPMASFKILVDMGGALKRFYNVSTTVSEMGPTAYAASPHLTINTLYPEDDSMDLAGLMDDSAEHPLLFY